MQKILLTMAVVMMSAMPAAAQTANQPKDLQLKDCQVKPDENGTQKQNGARPKAESNSESNNLSASLEPCNGVLKPPPTGDRNATVPPADNSQMPIIKPGELPPQTAK